MPPPDELHHPNCRGCPLTSLPHYHDGLVIRFEPDGGTLDLGVRRDPRLGAVNDLAQFAEQWEGLATRPDGSIVNLAAGPLDLHVDGDQRFVLYPEGTFMRLDGGTLPTSRWYYLQLRWRVRARRAWGWLLYGWRWW